MKKSILIIGAGPSGLVTAKTFLDARASGACEWQVTVMEKRGRVGGCWAVDAADTDTDGGAGGAKVEEGEEGDWVLNGEMRTNLSRYTVGFADLAWESVVGLGGAMEEQANMDEGASGKDLDSDGAGKPDVERGGGEQASRVSMFPKAWQVGRYLQAYADMFLPNGVVQLNKKVLGVHRMVHLGCQKWKVEWEDTRSNVSADRGHSFYDYLVVASGFFSKSRSLNCKLERTASQAHPSAVNIIHSSRFRKLEDFIPTQWNGPGNLLVIGGSMSGSEAAASLAFQLSSSKYSPCTRGFENLKVVQIVSRPFYALPRMVPAGDRDDAHAGTFVPLDLCLYDLSRRAAGPIIPMSGRMPPQKAQSAHKFIRSLVGSDQADLGAQALVSTSTDAPAYVAISDNYSEFVRSGEIVPVAGLGLEKPHCWIAKADHLCIDDMYETTYDFRFRGIALETFGVKHAVKGPKKDYFSDTWYER